LADGNQQEETTMNQQERSMIEGLFQRLQQAEAQAGPRDAEADALIRNLMARHSAAPYLLAQVVLVQEQGLQNLQARVEELERSLAEQPQGGGFLGGLFGGGQAQPASRPPAVPQPAASTGWSNTRFGAQGGAPAQPGAQGGGFMAGAMQTAMGVAGGVLLANAVTGLFADEAQAAEPPMEPGLGAAEDEGGLFGDFGDEEF